MSNQLIPNSEPVPVFLSSLNPSPFNQRYFPKKDQGLQSLAESIVQHGLLHPIIVRPVADSKFEVVCGDRRRRAFLLLKRDSIPGVVLELSDDQSKCIMTTENLHREDLTPLQEAASIASLVSSGIEVSVVAESLGKTSSWVVRRSKLVNLTKKWQDACSDSSNAFSKFSPSHLFLVARFSQSKQNDLYKDLLEMDYNNDISTMSIADLNQRLLDTLFCLSDAVWKLSDETLVIKAGACNLCSKRSSCEPDLFDEVKSNRGVINDFCLDRKCWGNKLVAFHESKIEKLKKTTPDLLLLSNGSKQETLPDDNPWKSIILREYSFMDCKKGDKGAQLAYIVDGSGVGSSKYVKSYSDNKASSQRVSGQPVPLADRREALKKRRTIRFITKVIQVLLCEQPVQASTGKNASTSDANPSDKEWPCPGKPLSTEILFSLISTFGTNPCTMEESFTNKPLVLFDHLMNGDDFLRLFTVYNCLFQNICTYLRVESNLSNPDSSVAAFVCESLSLDATKLWEIVETEIREPKIWAKLNNDGTPKTTISTKKESTKPIKQDD